MRIFYEEGHKGLDHMVKINDKNIVSRPLEKKGFWAYELNSSVPHGLNLKGFT